MLYFFVDHRIIFYSHIGHVKDLPQGLITAVIHLHKVCSGETIVVLVLGYLRWQVFFPC